MRHAVKSWHLKKSPEAARLASLSSLAAGYFEQAGRWYALNYLFSWHFFPEAEEVIGVLETNQLHDIRVIDEPADRIEITPYPRDPGEIGTEKEFFRKPFKFWKVLQKILRRKS